MNAKIRKQLAQSKRRISRRLDRNDNTGCEWPMITASNLHYEIAERTHGIAAGGIGAMHLVAKKLGLPEAIDRRLQLLKVHLPYHERLFYARKKAAPLGLLRGHLWKQMMQ